MLRVHTHILIADPHVLFRRGLRTVLSNEPDFDVTDDESTLDDILSKVIVRTDSDPSYPDALLVCSDLLSQCSGEQSKVLDELQSRSIVLALTTNPAEGCKNVIARDAAPAAIVRAVRQAVETRRTGFSYSLDALQRQTQPQLERAPTALTARELEIVRLLADGLTARDTARELSLSVKTVEAHKLNAMRKLGVHKRSDLLRYAEQNGIVQPATAA